MDETTTEPSLVTEALSRVTARVEAALASGGADPRVVTRLARMLTEPAQDLVARRSKQLRGRLVALGCELARAALGPAARPVARDATEQLAAALELLHAGSLIVDDIQDGSRVRRGGASLHLVYGLPRALCTGNWLYFVPPRLFAVLALPPDGERRLYRLYHETLEKAHWGQALDVGVKIEDLARDEIAGVCRAVATLKTGSVTALAFGAGAILAGTDDAGTEAFARYGEAFGLALQELDDAGNVRGAVDPEKRYEDLLASKPSTIWAFAAEEPGRLAALVDAVEGLPDDDAPLTAWIETTGYGKAATARARRMLDDAGLALARDTGLSSEGALASLRAITEGLLHAYGG